MRDVTKEIKIIWIRWLGHSQCKHLCPFTYNKGIKTWKSQ